MTAALRMIAGPVVFIFWLAAVRFFFIAIINQYRAAKNRKPGVSHGRAFDLLAMICRRPLYTDEGEQAAKRTLFAWFGFIACAALGMSVGWLAGFFR